jgi:hypothetical protein
MKFIHSFRIPEFGNFCHVNAPRKTSGGSSDELLAMERPSHLFELLHPQGPRQPIPFRRWSLLLRFPSFLPMKTLVLKTIFAAGCLGVVVACNPTQPTPPMKTTETTAVEEKIRNFKADPSTVNMQEVEKALADLNSEIKELELRQSTVGGAEKDEVTRKLTDLREKYNAYTVEFAAARVQATANKAGEATGEALKKAGEAVKDAAQSVGDSMKSEKKSN